MARHRVLPTPTETPLSTVRTANEHLDAEYLRLSQTYQSQGLEDWDERAWVETYGGKDHGDKTAALSTDRVRELDARLLRLYRRCRWWPTLGALTCVGEYLRAERLDGLLRGLGADPQRVGWGVAYFWARRKQEERLRQRISEADRCQKLERDSFRQRVIRGSLPDDPSLLARDLGASLGPTFTKTRLQYFRDLAFRAQGYKHLQAKPGRPRSRARERAIEVLLGYFRDTTGSPRHGLVKKLLEAIGFPTDKFAYRKAVVRVRRRRRLPRQ